jgi:RNA polymerase sigma factor (sigma-70 family)
MTEVGSRGFIERVPVFVRVPVTKEHVAGCINSDFVCSRSVCSCSEYNRVEILHEGIIKLVYKHAHSYRINSDDTFEDLVQECCLRIWKRLSGFDPKKASLTTWIWYVCLSVLNRNYAKTKKRKNNIAQVGDDVYHSVGITYEPFSLKEQMKEVIFQLHEKYPERQDVLLAMFGDPKDEEFQLPGKICVSEIARDLDKPYMNVYFFYRKKVCRYFKKCFSEQVGD